METAIDAVLVKSSMPEDLQKDQVKGYDFSKLEEKSWEVEWEKLIDTYQYSGFQATSLGKAIDQVNKMVLSSLIY
jgi:deoxyhypusine synthase